MLRRSLLAFAPVATGAALLAACNAITGVNDLSIPGGTGAAGATGVTSSGGVGGFGTGGSGVGAGEPPPPEMLPAQGVTIDQIAIYQGVKRSLMGGTPPSSGITVPVVAGRPALVRVFVKTDAGYDNSPITAHLFLGQDQTPLEVVGAVSSSTDSSLGSTVNFDVPGDKVVLGQTYRVELLQPPTNTTGMNAGAAYPATGSAQLDVKSDGMQLKVKIVPIRYGADSSNRLPDTSQQQIDGYKSYFFRTYPVANTEITVHAAVQWNQTISPNGSGWSQILDTVAQLRQQEGTPPDVYYFGVFAPAPSFNQFCSSGCVAGLGMVGSATDNYSRAAVGLGYSGDDAWTTAIHEIGHTHGRNHSPCGGAQGVDPDYPYSGANIGVWGYDLGSKQLIGPSQGKDVMGYCDPIWISDYTYKAFFDRIKLVNKAKVIVPDELMNQAWERVRVDGQGNLTWLSAVQMELPPSGQATPVTVQGAGGPAVVDAQFIPYDHLPGGVLLWQQAAVPVSAVQVTLGGKVSSVTR